MVFRRRGIKSIYNKKYNRIWNKEQNNHYHLNRSCIHQKDKTVEYRDIMMNDETFEALSVERMKVLNDLGFLIFIVENKKKQMQMKVNVKNFNTCTKIVRLFVRVLKFMKFINLELFFVKS